MKSTAFILLALTATAGCKTRSNELSELESVPNQAFTDIYHTDHDGGLYENIQEKFSAQKWNYQVNLKNLQLNWPLQDEKTPLLTRFSTPTIVSLDDDKEASDKANWFVYLHEGLDIARSQTKVSTDVRAPVSGEAIIIHDVAADADEPKTPLPYNTAVVIYDKNSHAIVSMLHVTPAANLKTDGFITVKAGDVVGTLAPLSGSGLPDDARLQHVHLSVMDLGKQMLINPMMHVSKYSDKIAPKIQRAFLMNEIGEVLTDLTDGALDIVIEASDRDRDSERPFEIAAIDFEVRDENNKVLRAGPDCDFGRFSEKNFAEVFDPRDALDLGNALTDGKAPAANQERTFRYVITNLKPNGNDTGCELIGDEKGFLLVNEKTQKIKVRVKVYDHMGNSTRQEFEFKRNQTAS